jgi:opacity protein-like surface antigen
MSDKNMVHLYGPNSGGMMKRVYIILFATIIAALLPAFAFSQYLDYPQYLDISNNGGGARAAGMGNAYLGISDDEMAYSWNPAGMIFIDKSKLGLQFQSKADKFNMPLSVESDTLHQVSVHDTQAKKNHFNLNFAGFAVPFTFIQRQWVVGGGYRNLYDMNFKFDYPGYLVGTSTYSEDGGMDAVSIALASKIIEGFGIGITANNYIRHSEINRFEPKSLPLGEANNFDTADVKINYRSHYSGFNMDIGLTGEVNIFRAGLVLRTPYNLTEKYLRTLTIFIPEGNGGIIDRVTATTKIPFSYAIGVSAKPIDKLILSLDYEHRPMSKSDVTLNFESLLYTDTTYNLKLKDLNEIRIGAEYTLSAGFAEIPLRAGFRKLPSVGTGFSQDANGNIMTGKQIKTNILSIGSGLHFKRAWLDLAYQFGNSKNSATITVAGYTPFDLALKQDYSRLTISGGMNF